jgi:exodeoxyribonuclease V alpha subunit
VQQLRTRIRRPRPAPSRSAASESAASTETPPTAEIIGRSAPHGRRGTTHPDLRCEDKQLVARTRLVAEPAVRSELVEEITARAAALSVPLLDRAGVPDHIRQLTSPRVIAVEADITGRLAVRGALGGTDTPADRVHTAAAAAGQLDPRQADAAAALAGDHPSS